MHKGEAIRKLKRKMKWKCNCCYHKNRAISKISNKYKIPDMDYCFTKCPVHIFTNLMIEEMNNA